MPAFGINFRASTPSVTDGANQTFCFGDAFQTDRGGLSFGFPTATADVRTRFATGDPRLAGVAFKVNDGAKRDFRVNLPGGPATYDIRLAIGDRANDQNNKIELFDGTTSFAVIEGATSTENFLDATGVNRTTTAWPGGNVALSRVFTSGYLIIRMGKDTLQTPSTSTVIAHLELNQTSSPPDTEVPTWPGGTVLNPSALTTTSFTVTASAAPTDNVGVVRIETSFDGGANYTTNTPALGLAASFSGGTPGATVQVRMRAVDAANNTSALLSLNQVLATTNVSLGPFGSSGTYWPNGTAVLLNWHPGWRAGDPIPGSSVVRSATVVGTGGLVPLTGLPAGAGGGLVTKRGATPDLDEVALTYGTVV